MNTALISVEQIKLGKFIGSLESRSSDVERYAFFNNAKELLSDQFLAKHCAFCTFLSYCNLIPTIDKSPLMVTATDGSGQIEFSISVTAIAIINTEGLVPEGKFPISFVEDNAECKKRR